MRVHVLGGGYAQLNMIRRLKELGHTVIVSDYLPDAPGKADAHYSSMVSTFDAEGIQRITSSYHADGIITLGTDQPVLTAAIVAGQLGLPSCVTVDQAMAVTHKRVMKQALEASGVPVVPWACVPEGFEDEVLKELIPPYVMKPLDSQGQRGIFKLDTIEEIRAHILQTLSFSRDSEVLVEQYYPHEELTVSGWVHGGRLTVLTITDRITRDTPPSIGVCFAHRFSTKHIAEEAEICVLSHRVVEAVGISEGPVYIQLLKGERGYLVNEVAARIGGAFEEYVIPAVTGLPVDDLLINAVLGEFPDPADTYNPNGDHAWVLFFFSRPGTVGKTGTVGELMEIEGVLTARYLVGAGDTLTPVTNATQRAGYVVCAAPPERIDALKEQLISLFTVQDENGCDMILPIEEAGR